MWLILHKWIEIGGVSDFLVKGVPCIFAFWLVSSLASAIEDDIQGYSISENLLADNLVYTVSMVSGIVIYIICLAGYGLCSLARWIF